MQRVLNWIDLYDKQVLARDLPWLDGIDPKQLVCWMGHPGGRWVHEIGRLDCVIEALEELEAFQKQVRDMAVEEFGGYKLIHERDYSDNRARVLEWVQQGEEREEEVTHYPDEWTTDDEGGDESGGSDAEEEPVKIKEEEA